MRDFNTKIDNDNTSAGVVVADEYNSNFSELKGAVTPFMGLNEADNKQLAKSIDIASKAMFYTDTGTPNTVILERGATTETLETLFDGMVVMFTPANANTGATTLKVKTLDAKALKYNGADLDAGYLKTGLKYIAVYNVANNRFDCDVITLGVDINSLLKTDGVVITDLDGVPVGVQTIQEVYEDGFANFSTTSTSLVLSTMVKNFTPLRSDSKIMVEFCLASNMGDSSNGGIFEVQKDGASVVANSINYGDQTANSTVTWKPMLIRAVIDSVSTASMDFELYIRKILSGGDSVGYATYTNSILIREFIV